MQYYISFRRTTRRLNAYVTHKVFSAVKAVYNTVARGLGWGGEKEKEEIS